MTFVLPDTQVENAVWWHIAQDRPFEQSTENRLHKTGHVIPDTVALQISGEQMML